MVKQFLSLIRLLHLILSVSTEFLKSFCSNSFKKMWFFCCLCYWWSTASHPYVAVGNTIHFRILSLVSILCPFHIDAIFYNFDVAIASLLLSSGELFLFASILAPRYSKLLTLSIHFPSSLITASFLHLSVSMILVFLTFRCSPFCSRVLLQTLWDSQALLLLWQGVQCHLRT